MTPSDLQQLLSLTNNQRKDLEKYAELLVKWQSRSSLVSYNTLTNLWSRHFLDSAQLLIHMKDLPGPVLDLGSGAGFPGLVLSIIGREDIVIVESDSRKIAFLQAVLSVIGVSPIIKACRIESLQFTTAGIITARALASVDKLLRYSESYSYAETVFLFLKGERVDEELIIAQNTWKMLVTKYSSIAYPRGVVLKLEKVIRV
ncbi:methyltransferase GidB [Candidatus Endolissoclinum faulkneri L2]|uniref:Ribosomal RNA small subunit methyltransferase G n=1 Tax=Candidatus Endolissoclinum faulkneri L2 TaxID=1193729 RepID=K7YSY5_9PROT|nr:16S rRNA (guanine(527)-N(7))-methyltransferase RsmG [Candidatus Endolissoclinum faulkneri]AFX99699.1 methyltransferase GidB [Candidatus Endolissoclinum faulkneri L2]